MPATTNTADPGAASLSWRHFYATGNIYLDGLAFITNPGTENNFIGTQSGRSISTGSCDWGTGAVALYTITTGSSNTAVGAEPLYINSNGACNSALGNLSLHHNTS